MSHRAWLLTHLYPSSLPVMGTVQTLARVLHGLTTAACVPQATIHIHAEGGHGQEGPSPTAWGAEGNWDGNTLEPIRIISGFLTFVFRSKGWVFFCFLAYFFSVQEQTRPMWPGSGTYFKKTFEDDGYILTTCIEGLQKAYSLGN